MEAEVGVEDVVDAGDDKRRGRLLQHRRPRRLKAQRFRARRSYLLLRRRRRSRTDERCKCYSNVIVIIGVLWGVLGGGLLSPKSVGSGRSFRPSLEIRKKNVFAT